MSQNFASDLRELEADGIITWDMGNISDILAIGLPTILCDIRRNMTDSHCVITDDMAIGEMAAEHLLERGFRQFAFYGFDQMFWSLGRAAGFRKKIEMDGFSVNLYTQPESVNQMSWAEKQSVLSDWLKSLPKPVGLMACNDDGSRQIIEACKTAGVYVPDEIAIIGVDNDSLVCELASPPVSSVAINTEKAGFETAQLLDKLMSGKKLPPQTIVAKPTQVVIRQSTDVSAIDDTEVAAAMRFIRSHARQKIQVGDVVESGTVSRRELERRFKKVLSRSILDEIRSTRVNEVAMMLVDTNVSISNIALQLGFSSVEHIARYFRKQKGISPQAYRRKCGHK
ncbi:MAG: helix-turn-helix domain-containing protein [Candidatus Brocadiia bacterium]|nr:MAG: helix-turn-helix domain-containing protein [Candidatus Brocadiia bacterium]